MRKVNLEVIRPWVVKKVIELVGFEDEVVVEYAMGLLEDNQEPVRFVPLYPCACEAVYLRGCVDSRPTQDAN